MSSGPTATPTRPPTSPCLRTLAIYLPTLGGGGVERVFLTLMRELAGRGVKSILVLDRLEGELVREVPAGSRVVPLRASRTLTAVPRLAQWLRRERPEIFFRASTTTTWRRCSQLGSRAVGRGS